MVAFTNAAAHCDPSWLPTSRPAAMCRHSEFSSSIALILQLAFDPNHFRSDLHGMYSCYPNSKLRTKFLIVIFISKWSKTCLCFWLCTFENRFRSHFWRPSGHRPCRVPRLSGEGVGRWALLRGIERLRLWPCELRVAQRCLGGHGDGECGDLGWCSWDFEIDWPLNLLLVVAVDHQVESSKSAPHVFSMFADSLSKDWFADDSFFQLCAYISGSAWDLWRCLPKGIRKTGRGALPQRTM